MDFNFSNFNPSDLQSSKKYLLKFLSTNQIEDVADQSKLEYMKFANALSGHILANNGDKPAYIFWKEVYGACLKSEKNLNYQFYKGHILVQVAVHYLVISSDLKKVIDLLNQARAEDKKFGYKNPAYRPAYKILSFLQPILMFRNQLWPSNEDVRKRFASRLSMVLFFNKASTGIAFHPDTTKKDLLNCVPKNNKLREVLQENVDELLEIMGLPDKSAKFYKSIMFLVANIVEGILYDFALRFQAGQNQENEKCSILKLFRKDKKINLEKLSISGLSKFLLKNKVIDSLLYYQCQFIQHYRDFIHPARNLKHEYRLDSNFGKMFIFFLILLFGDFSKVSSSIG